MRFPRYTVGLFFVLMALHVVLGYQADHHCYGGLGAFNCAGWIRPFVGLVYMWHLLMFIVIPILAVSAVLAVVRLAQWRGWLPVWPRR